MPRQFFTAEDIKTLARLQGSNTLLLGPEDVITQEAEDTAAALGIHLLRAEDYAVTLPAAPVQTLPPLKVVHGGEVPLAPFGASTPANVRLKDIITSKDSAPMASGYMSLEKGEFPWTLTYDEIDVVLEGELAITRGSEVVRGNAGDVIYISKGSAITFSTPNRARFVYITFPADWEQK